MAEPTRPRATTIVWGVILLLAAAIGFAVIMGLSGPAVIWAVVAFGALLVLAGVVGAVVQVARRSTREG